MVCSSADMNGKECNCFVAVTSVEQKLYWPKLVFLCSKYVLRKKRKKIAICV